jgi:nucleoside phosphorylase
MSLILIVEDDSEWQKILKQILSENGFTCEVVSSYLAALNRLEAKPFSAITLDLKLANKEYPADDWEGWPLAQLARAKNIHSVIVSASFFEEHIRRAFRKFQVVDFLDKGNFVEQDFLQGIVEAVDLTNEARRIEKQKKPTVGIITALEKEYAAVSAMLENVEDIDVPGRGAGRLYRIGEVPDRNGRRHSVALSLLADMGNNIATNRATLLLEHFPKVNNILMVGIAGGIPDPSKPEEHVRLGDIVVSNEKGVIQYDFDRETIVEVIHRHRPRPPSATLLQSAKCLRVEELEGKRPWLNFIQLANHLPNSTRPPEETDRLAATEDPTQFITHPESRRRLKGVPRVFLGPIASANKLLKNPSKRDALRDKFGVKAAEMEGSGIADATWNYEVGYLIIRGICDYCDSNKGDDWQEYAAIVAAAYTRALIEVLAA